MSLLYLIPRPAGLRRPGTVVIDARHLTALLDAANLAAREGVLGECADPSDGCDLCDGLIAAERALGRVPPR
jgi:hypothetical protein